MKNNVVVAQRQINIHVELEGGIQEEAWIYIHTCGSITSQQGEDRLFSKRYWDN